MSQTVAPYPGSPVIDNPVMADAETTAVDANESALSKLDGALHWIRCACPTIPVLGIQWIQIQYPVYPEQAFLMDGIPGPSILSVVRRSVRELARSIKHAVLSAWRIALTKRILRQQLVSLRRRSFDVIVKSWSVGARPPDDSSDFYFGDLQAQLAARGQESLILYGDAKGDDWRTFVREQSSTGRLSRLPEICLLHPIDPLVTVVRQVWSSALLLGLALRTPAGLRRRACLLAAQSVLGPRTTRNATYHTIGSRAGLQWSPRALVSLYEGRSWERCLWAGVRSSQPDCLVGGYQHAILVPGLLSLLDPKHDAISPAVPDVVLCQGLMTRKQLAPGYAKLGVETLAFGSYRRVTDGGKPTSPMPSRKTILVLPVGFMEESRCLFDFAISLAARMPDHMFILRCHPILDMDGILGDLKISPDHVQNVTVSREPSFAADVSRASAVLYRGTAAVLAATLGGLKPLYYGEKGERSEDPLNSMVGWREHVRGEDECVGILEGYALTSPSAAKLEWQSAADYVQDYATPVDGDSYSDLGRTLRLGM